MRVWSLIFVGLALSCAVASARPSINTHNKQTSTDIVRFLVEYLTKDVENNRAGIAKSNEEIEKLANTIIAYVDKTNSETTVKVEATLKAMQNANDRNMKMMMDKVVQNDNSLKTHTYANTVKLGSALTNTTNNALDEIKSRMNQHEDLLSTHVAVCGYASSHLTKGLVHWDQLFLDSITIKGKTLRPTSDRMRQGIFDVPEGGDGTYQISYGLILDTIGDLNQVSARVSFALKSQIDNREVVHRDSVITSTAGYPGHDLVPASRTINLDMKYGDTISLEQFFPTAENSYQLNMCVHLVHPRPPGYNNWLPIERAVAPALETHDIFEATTLEEFTVDDQSITVPKPNVTISAPEVMTWPNAPFIGDWAPLKAPIPSGACTGIDPTCNAMAPNPLGPSDAYAHDGLGFNIRPVANPGSGR